MRALPAIRELILTKGFYSRRYSDALMHELIDDVPWHADYYEAFGRRFEIPRLQAWIADDGIQYSYSNNLLPVLPWSQRLWAVKQDVEHAAGHRFNAVLLTYYRHGEDHVTWHADDERELGPEPVIASLSLGATRSFSYSAGCGDATAQSLFLGGGDLLLMLPAFQRGWQHCVPMEPAVRHPRINLTFRRVVNPA